MIIFFVFSPAGDVLKDKKYPNENPKAQVISVDSSKFFKIAL